MARATVSRLNLNDFHPSSLAEYELHLRADYITHVADGGAVDYWRDEGRSQNACVATGTAQPLWVDDELNGRSVVRFDGVNDVMKATSPSTPVLAHNILVWKYTGGATFESYDGIITGQNALNADVRIQGENGTTTIRTNDIDIPGGGFVHIDGATAHDNDFGDLTTWHILSVFDNTSAALDGSGAVPNYQLMSDRVNAGRFCKCDVAEIIGFSSALSAADELSVVTYLNDKYDIL